MNKKQKTSLLLLLVIGIWGLIGHTIYRYLNPDELVYENQIQNPPIVKEGSKLTDSLIISNYRDPFLGKIKTKKKKHRSQGAILINFPLVTYHGLVHGGNEKYYIISVQNEQEIMKIGQFFLNVKLISANAKQIAVSHKGTRKIIKLQD